jgi:hypothetical protein
MKTGHLETYILWPNFFAPSLFPSPEVERQSQSSSSYLLYFFVTSSLFTIINVPFMTADDSKTEMTKKKQASMKRKFSI